MVDKTKKTLQERISELEVSVNKAKDEAKRYSELHKTRQAELENLKVLLEKETLEAENAAFAAVGVTRETASQLQNSGLTLNELLTMAGVTLDTAETEGENDVQV